MGAATCMAKHAGINSPSSAASRLSTSVSVGAHPLPAPSLPRFLHRQHEHRRRDRGRRRRPGFPHDAPRHQEPGFWKTPPVDQRCKQILHLSCWETRGQERTLGPGGGCTGSGSFQTQFVSYKHSNGVFFLIYAIITTFGDTFQLLLLN